LYAQWTFKNYNVGDRGPANGYIFYVNPNATQDGWTYLEALDRDLGSGYAWDVGTDNGMGGLTFISVTEAQNSGMGYGYSNSFAIYTKCTTATAAFMTLQYSCSFNGSLFSDWFLPSLDELSRMYSTIRNISGSGFSTTTNSWYWSSTQATMQTAYCINFNNGASTTYPKNNSYRIRPVRRF
jgi:hypothetical protein